MAGKMQDSEFSPFDADNDAELRAHPRRKQEQPTVGEWLVVDEPEIREVMCTESGQHYSVRDVIGKDFAQLMALRMRVREKLQSDPLYRCSICGVAVHLCSSSTQRRFFFKHREQDGSCPANTAGALNQDEINARKYNGAKESKLHLRMKDWITQCLTLDPLFDGIKQEARWNGGIPSQWRKPDITASFQGVRIAFEIQLSTTPLSVIAARRIFYHAQGAHLIWIFAEFEEEYRRLTEDDIFFSNNLNAFVVNQKTVAASIKANEFMVEAVWVQPMERGGLSGLHRRVIPFHTLTLQARSQRAFWFDFDAAKLKLESRSSRDELRGEIEAWWLAGGPLGADGVASAQWKLFQQRLKTEGVDATPYFGDYFTTLKVLYCAKHGRAVCDRRGTLIAVAHGVISTHKRDLSWFVRALQVFGHEKLLAEQDPDGKFQKKRVAAREQYKIDATPFKRNDACTSVVEFLFPELAA